MAALNAASQARIANSRSAAPPGPSGTSSGSYLGGIASNAASFQNGTSDMLSPNSGQPNFHLQNPPQSNLPPPNSAPNTSFLESMSQSNLPPRNSAQNPVTLKQRQMGFLAGVARAMIARNTPLPPALTGFDTPTYDPNNTQWKHLELTGEVGVFRLAGKDIDLLKLWGLIFQNGGFHAVCPQRFSPSRSRALIPFPPPNRSLI